MPTTMIRPYTEPQRNLIADLLGERYISEPEAERLRPMIRNLYSTKQATAIINRLKRLPFRSEMK